MTVQPCASACGQTAWMPQLALFPVPDLSRSVTCIPGDFCVQAARAQSPVLRKFQRFGSSASRNIGSASSVIFEQGLGSFLCFRARSWAQEKKIVVL